MRVESENLCSCLNQELIFLASKRQINESKPYIVAQPIHCLTLGSIQGTLLSSNSTRYMYVYYLLVNSRHHVISLCPMSLLLRLNVMNLLMGNTL